MELDGTQLLGLAKLAIDSGARNLQDAADKIQSFVHPDQVDETCIELAYRYAGGK